MKLAIVINVLQNICSGPGGRARHLHEGDLGLDTHGKARLSLEMIPRKRIEKRSANSATKMGMVATAMGMTLAMVAMVPANGNFSRNRRNRNQAVA